MIDNNQMAQVVWEFSPDAIVVVGSDGLILKTNASISMLGYTPDELVGQPVEVLVPPSLRVPHVGRREGYFANPVPRVMGSAFSLVAVTKSGTDLPVDIALSPVDLDGGRGVVAVIRDVTERRGFEEKLRYLSFHDTLTGLYNRAFFEEHIARLEQGRSRPIAFLVVDVDGLKAVNDNYGHDKGDILLKRAAEILKKSLRVEDVVARVGGDEFIAVLQGGDESGVRAAMERVCENAQASDIHVGMSVGWSVAKPGDLLVDSIRVADARMYEEKRRRRAAASSSTAEH